MKDEKIMEKVWSESFKEKTIGEEEFKKYILKAIKLTREEELRFLKNKVSHFFVRDFFTNEIDDDWKKDNNILVENVLERIKQLEKENE